MFFCLYRASHTGLLRSPSLIHVGELVRGAENVFVCRLENPCMGNERIHAWVAKVVLAWVWEVTLARVSLGG